MISQNLSYLGHNFSQYIITNFLYVDVVGKGIQKDHMTYLRGTHSSMCLSRCLCLVEIQKYGFFIIRESVIANNSRPLAIIRENYIKKR